MSDEIIQGSPEWLAIRLGKATASRMADICARTRTGWGASRANYKVQFICERLTGMAHEGYTNGAMSWGVEKEPDARRAYEFMRDETVTEVGFVEHPTIAMAGASPDGLVGEDGLIEVKCPISGDPHRDPSRPEGAGQILPANAVPDVGDRPEMVRLRQLRSPAPREHATVHRSGRARRRLHPAARAGRDRVPRRGRRDRCRTARPLRGRPVALT